MFWPWVRESVRGYVILTDSHKHSGLIKQANVTLDDYTFAHIHVQSMVHVGLSYVSEWHGWVSGFLFNSQP